MTESLSERASKIAHDLNNLLATIRIDVELAKMSIPVDSESYGHLLDADKVVYQACNMVKKLHNIAKDRICETSKVSILKTILKNSNHSLLDYDYDLQVSDDAWTVEIDEEQLGRVLVSLLTYISEKQKECCTIQIVVDNIVILADGSTSLIPGDYVKISLVYQNGATGILSDFSQAGLFGQENNNQEKKLALCLASSIIHNHSGTLQVLQSGKSEEGRIDIYLPASTHQIFVSNSF